MAALLLALITMPATAGPRVASINMCTDQLVLALANPEQIVGLSALSRDPELSFYADKARAFRTLSGAAEDVLPLRPDVVVTATFARPHTRGLLAAAGLPVEAFGNAASIADVKAQIRRMGALLAQAGRAEAAVAGIDAAADAARSAARGPAPLVLPLERRGWITGRQTLLTDLLVTAGYRSLGADLLPQGGLLPLEIIAGLKPDRLLLHARPGRSEDQGAAMLRHPALGHLLAAPPIILPEKLVVCAGPMLADAFAILQKARGERR